jgi:hypothetical protein
MTQRKPGPLVGAIVLASAMVLGILAALVWGRVVPVDASARPFVALGLGLAAAADAVVGLVFLLRASSS